MRISSYYSNFYLQPKMFKMANVQSKTAFGSEDSDINKIKYEREKIQDSLDNNMYSQDSVESKISNIKSDIDYQDSNIDSEKSKINEDSAKLEKLEQDKITQEENLET